MNKKLVKALSKPSVKGSHTKINSIGVLYNHDTFQAEELKSDLAKQLSVSENAISLLGFVTFKKKMPSLTQEQFSDKDFSWKGDVSAENVKQFLNKDFDLLLSYYEEEHSYLDLLTAISSAPFKVGSAKKEEVFFDLLINVSINNTSGFISEIKKYGTLLGKI